MALISLFDELRWRAQLTPDASAAFTIDADISYRTVFMLSEKIAHGVQMAGVRCGDRIAVHVGNRYELMAIYFALLGVGAVIVPVALKLSPGEIGYLLKHSAATYYIGDAQTFDQTRDLLGSIETIEKAWIFDLSSMIDKAAPFSDLLVEGHAELDTIAPATMGAILYSSGTTGRPTGVAYSHDTLRQSMKQIGAMLDAGTVRICERAVGVCSMVDWVSAWSLLMCLTCVPRGRPLAISITHTPEQMQELLQSGRVGVLAGAPSNFRALLDAARSGRIGTLNLRETNCVTGGDACPAELAKAFHATFGTPLQCSYGQTESGGPAIYHPNLSDETEPAIGWKLDGIEVRIDAKQGDAGGLWIRSPAKPLGIWNGSGIDRLTDSWLYTGDLVRERPSDGCIMFLSRLKDVMKIGGFSLAPIELEQVIAGHPAVAAAAVFGVPDAVLGERPVAMVQLRNGAVVTADAISQYLCGRIAEYKYPHEIIFVDRLPFTPNGKISRTNMAKEYLSSRMGERCAN